VRVGRVAEITALGAILAAAAGCSEPAWRDPALAKGSATPPAAVTAAARADGYDLPASPRRDRATSASIPGPPAWAKGLLGQPLRIAYPLDGKCVGNNDGLKHRYDDGAGGVDIAGWAWDPATKAPVQRVVLVDALFIVRGAGDTGARRRDVPRVVPQITSQTTGWEALTPLNTGSLDAYGLLADGRSVCRLGHVDF
jgi:hypothetical protein